MKAATSQMNELLYVNKGFFSFFTKINIPNLYLQLNI